MSKKSVITIIIIIIVITISVLICFLGYKDMTFKIETKGGLKSNGLSYAIANNNGKSKFSYSINLTNTNGKVIFIKSIQPSINQTMKNNILSNEIIIDVNKDIKPNETIQVNGEIFVDTKGLHMERIRELITDIKVSTEETVSLK